MSSLLFAWAGPTPLAAELRKPIKQISVEFVIPNSGPRFVTLWRPDETGLRLFTEMHDVAERREVGVLHFEQVFALGPSEVITDLPSVFQGENVVFKLVIHESGTKGVRIRQQCRGPQRGYHKRVAAPDRYPAIFRRWLHREAACAFCSSPHISGSGPDSFRKSP